MEDQFTRTDKELFTLFQTEFQADESLFMLAKVTDKLSNAGYWFALRNLYAGARHLYLANHFIGTLFHADRLGREHLMTDHERGVVNKLMPNVLRVYRGCWSSNDTGWSYTLNKEAARAYAVDGAYDGHPVILCARIHKNNIEACWADGHIVVDPRRVLMGKVQKVPFRDADRQRVEEYLKNGTREMEPEWIRLQFLTPVIQTLLSVQRMAGSVSVESVARLFETRVEVLARYGFVEHAEKVDNQRQLLLNPTEEVKRWMDVFTSKDHS